jgi:DNA repair protein RecO (recombination protein O)
MHFRDIGIIISKKPLKENAYIVSVFTKDNGLYSGVVSNISKKSRHIYMEGNLVDFFWKARLVDHLGMVKCELIKSYSGFLITDKLKLYAFNSIISIIKIAFCEREPHNNLFPILEQYLNKTTQKFNFRDYVNLELAILLETGYGLSLNACAVTGASCDLYFVSPKSGKAVSFEIGKSYADKLLKLPNILIDPNATVTSADITQSFELTSYFFNRYCFHNKPEPKERLAMINTLVESLSQLQ